MINSTFTGYCTMINSNFTGYCTVINSTFTGYCTVINCTFTGYCTVINSTFTGYCKMVDYVPLLYLYWLLYCDQLYLHWLLYYDQLYLHWLLYDDQLYLHWLLYYDRMKLHWWSTLPSSFIQQMFLVASMVLWSSSYSWRTNSQIRLCRMSIVHLSNHTHKVTHNYLTWFELLQSGHTVSQIYIYIYIHTHKLNGLVWFYGISTIVGYLMPNFFIYIYTKYMILDTFPR